jgi:hypothetical protein
MREHNDHSAEHGRQADDVPRKQGLAHEHRDDGCRGALSRGNRRHQSEGALAERQKDQPQPADVAGRGQQREAQSEGRVPPGRPWSAASANANTYLSTLIAWVIALPVSYVYAKLSSVFPRSGGDCALSLA